jgi:hypothetical protein
MFRGNPSGQYNTALDNTLILHVVILYVCFKNKMPRHLIEELDMMLYGDDSVIFLTKEQSVYFNQELFSCAVQDFGMQLEFSPYLEFLGHAVIWHVDWKQYVMILPMERMISALYYCARDNSIEMIWQRICGIRIASYTNPYCFDLIDRYCKWFFDKYGNLFNLSNDHYVPEILLQHLYNVGDASVFKNECSAKRLKSCKETSQ